MPAFRLRPREIARQSVGAVTRSCRVLAMPCLALFVALLIAGLSSEGRAATRSRESRDDAFRQVAELRPQPNRSEPRFGKAVAVLGKTVLVASPPIGDSTTSGGAVHVFNESRSGWRRVQRLSSPDPQAEDRFGQSLAASRNWLVVGRDRADDAGADAGAISVFRKVGLHYRFEATLLAEKPDPGDGFGACVAVDRERIAAGAARDDDAALDAGSVSTFELAGESWNRTAHLVAPDAAASDWFGCAVALAGERLLVGAYGDDDRGEKSGAAYLWRRTGEHDRPWEFEMKFAPGDLAAGDWFGFSCAIAGGYLAIGAPRDDVAGESAGCVRVYRRSQDEWVLDATLRPPEGSLTAWFGYAVALDERNLVVGAPGDDVNGESSGAVYCYSRESGGWRLAAEIRPPSAETEFQCGAAVARDASLVAIGRLWPEDGEIAPGHTWVYELTAVSKASAVSGSSTSSKTQPTRAPSTPTPPDTSHDDGDSSTPPVNPTAVAVPRTCVGVRGPSP